MAINYPLAFPTHTSVRTVELRTTNAVAYSRSPFTFAGQAHVYSGQMWQIDASLPPMRRTDAERWVAWLVSLGGQRGTFLMGDPTSCAPRSASAPTSATISGAAGSASVTVAMTGTLLAGDMIQISTGADATLHKVLIDKTNGGTLEIWPALRKARSTVAVDLTHAKGLFRLASNETSYSVNEMSIYGVSFSAVEAV